MTFPIGLTLAVLLLVVVALWKFRGGPEYILGGGLALLIVCGVVDTKAALVGFASEGVATVAILFVVAEGMRQTGGISFVSQLLGQPQSLKLAQLRLMMPSAVLSSFMNNTPVVALMMPVVGDWARKLRLSVSYLYLPLSYAAILGGMCTLIGTSTTVVLNDLLKTHLGQSLSMFEIGWVGIPSMFVGLAYLLICSRFLLKERQPAFAELDDPREYTVEMLVPAGSSLVGRSIEEAGLRNLPGMYLMEIDRRGHVLPAVASNTILESEDRLVFVGIVESVVDLQKTSGLTPATNQLFKLDGPRAERCLIEAVVSNSCPLINRTIREAKFRSQYNAAVIAVARNGERIKKKIGDIELNAGDTLLLETHPSFIDRQRNSRDFFLVSEIEDSAPTRHEKVWLARLILLGMIVLVAVEVLSMFKAALVAASLMIITRCCRGSEAKRAIDWSLLIVIGAGLGLGAATKSSGTAEWLAGSLIQVVGNRPTLMLIVLYTITSILTNLITAKAAGVLVFPIAMAAAQHLEANGVDVSSMAFAIAVIISAAASFATPIGYQTNLMVYGPGGYRYSDFMKIGVPLTVIVGIITVIVTPFVWPA